LLHSPDVKSKDLPLSSLFGVIRRHLTPGILSSTVWRAFAKDREYPQEQAFQFLKHHDHLELVFFPRKV